MSDESMPREMNKALFTSLVLSLSTSAMQQLGKLVNPLTGKTEADLDAAQITIDMLSMLKEKTRGNRDADEERLLTDVLSSLQMNYVETANAVPAGEKKEEPPSAGNQEPAAPSPAPEQGQADGNSKEKRRFHKSYG